MYIETQMGKRKLIFIRRKKTVGHGFPFLSYIEKLKWRMNGINE